MFFENVVCNFFNTIFIANHIPSFVNNQIFQIIFLNCFKWAIFFMSSFTKTVVVIVFFSVSTRATFSNHHRMAISTNEFSRKYKVKLIFLFSWNMFVCISNWLNFLPSIVINNCGINVCINNISMNSFANIFSICNNFINLWCVNKNLCFCPNSTSFQFFCYINCCKAICKLVIYFFYNFSLIWINNTFLIFYIIAIYLIATSKIAF